MLETIEQNIQLELTGRNKPLQIHFLDCGQGDPLLYLHGWGQDHQAFIPLIENQSNSGRHIALDFPGFGQSTQPSYAWGVPEYAEFVFQFIQRQELSPCVAIGHSFGGRVAFWLARQHPECLRGLFLIGSAGIRRKIPFLRQLRISAIRSIARTAQRGLPVIGEKIKQILYRRIASRDYAQAGSMRAILVNVVNDDLSAILPSIQHPVVLLYGSDDRETPPEMGRQMHHLLPHSEYIELPGFDHYSILTRGRHQMSHQLHNFLQKVEQETTT